TPPWWPNPPSAAGSPTARIPRSSALPAGEVRTQGARGGTGDVAGVCVAPSSDALRLPCGGGCVGRLGWRGRGRDDAGCGGGVSPSRPGQRRSGSGRAPGVRGEATDAGPELQRSTVETATGVHAKLEDLRRDLLARRRER